MTSSPTRIALFAGSFDPFTKGHHDLVVRSMDLFDQIVIGIGIHAGKQSFFTPEQRLKQISSLFPNHPKVTVQTYLGLTADFAKKVGATILVRGVRSATDFEYERSIAEVNKRLGNLETVLLLCKPAFAHISSSVVRDLLSWNQDISDYLPEGMQL